MDPHTRARGLIEVGDFVRDQIGDLVMASGHYVAAVEVQPRAPELGLTRLTELAELSEDVEITANLVAGLSQAGYWHEVVEVLARQAARSTDDDERAGLLLAAARTAERRLGDPVVARAHVLAAAQAAGRGTASEVLAELEQRLVRTPDDAALAVSAARIHTFAGRPASALVLLEEGAKHVGHGPARASMLLDAGILAMDQLEAGLDAVRLFSAAVLSDGDLAGPVGVRLDALAEAHGDLPAVVEALVEHWHSVGDEQRVHELLARAMRGLEPEARGARRLKVALHAEHGLGDPVRAFALFREGLEQGEGPLEPFAEGMRRVGAVDVPGALETMVAQFTRLKLWRPLVGALEDAAALESDDPRRALLVFRAGEILERELRDLGGAVRCYVRAFKLQPSEMTYLAAGERVYEQRGDWRMVDRLLGLQVRVASAPELRRGLLERQARVRARQLGDALGAYEVLRALLTSEDGTTAEVVGDLLKDTVAFTAVIDGLNARVRDAGGSSAVQLYLEIAALQLEVRGAQGAGAVALRMAVEAEPEDGALFTQVRKRLRGLETPAARAAWLVRCAGRGLPAPVRVEALREAAQIYVEIGQPVDAVAPLRSALGITPRDVALFLHTLGSAEAAAPQAAAEILEAALRGEVGPADASAAQQMAWLVRLASLYLLVEDSEAAAGAYGRILALDPLHGPAFDALTGYLRAREDGPALFACCDARIAHLDGIGQVAPLALVRETAALAEAPMGRLSEAIELQRRVLAEAPDDAAASIALHRLYTATGDRAGHLGLLQLELADASDGITRRSVAVALAARAVEPPVQHDAYVLACSVLVDLDPDDPVVIDRLIGALRAVDRPRALADALGQRWAAAPNGGSLDVLRERGRILMALGAFDEAAGCWADVLAHHPNDDDVLAALQAVHRARGEHEALHAVLWRRHELQLASETAVPLLAEAAQVAEDALGDLPRAAAAWRRVLGWKPHDDEVEESLLRIYEASEDWSALMRLGEDRLSRLSGLERAELARRLARLALSALNDRDLAGDLWTVVHEEAPLDREALVALIDLAELRRDNHGAAALLEALVLATPEAKARRTVLERRAEVLEGLGDLAQAVEVWAEVRALAPDDRVPVTAIRRLAQAAGDTWGAARALVAELRFVTDPIEALSLNQQLARASAALGDQLGGLTAWERVISLVAPGTHDEEEALGALKHLYTDLGRSDDLVRVLRRLLDRAPDDAARVRHLIDTAELFEALRGDLSEAFEYRLRAWGLVHPPEPEAMAQLRRLAAAGSLWARYAEVLVIAQERTTSEAEIRALLLEQAVVEAEELDAPDRALATARRAFQMSPRDVAAFDAVRLYARAQRAWRIWVETLQLHAGQADGVRRGALLAEAGFVCENELDDPSGAFVRYAEAADCGVGAAEEALVRLAEASGQWDELVARFARRRDEASQVPTKLAVIARLATLLEERAGDWERAFEQRLIALQIEPMDPEARAAVWRMAEQHDAWPLVARVLGLKAKTTESPSRKVALLEARAEIQAEQMQQPKKAFSTLKLAFAVRPWDEGIRTRLNGLAEVLGTERALAAFYEEEASWAEDRQGRVALFQAAVGLFEGVGEVASAARVLRRIVDLEPTEQASVARLLTLRRKAGDTLALAGDLETLVRLGAERQRVGYLEALAALYTGPLEAPAKAEETYRRLLVLREGDGASFEALVESLVARRAWPALDEALEKRASTAEGEGRFALLRRRAAVLQDHLGRAREAFELLVEVARAHPEDVALLHELSERAAAADGHGLLLTCAEHSAAVVEPEQLADVLVLVGRTARDRFGNDKKARKHLLRALELRPDDIELAREVASLLTARRLHAELAGLYERVGPGLVAEPGEAADAPAVDVRWALTLAQMQAEQLYEAGDALETVCALVERQPASVEAAQRWLELAEKVQDGAQMELAALHLATLPVRDTLAVLRNAARTQERIGESDRSVTVWRALLRLDPDDHEALTAVKRFAEQRRDWDLLADQLQARAQATECPGPVWVELGRLHRETRGDIDAAQAAYGQALAADPDDGTAFDALVDIARARDDWSALDALTDRAVVRMDSAPPAVAETLAPRAASLLLGRAGRCEDATERLRLLALGHAFSPDHIAVALAYADALYAAGDELEAAALYGALPLPSFRGPDAADQKAWAHLRRGSAFRLAGRQELALRHYEVAGQPGVTQVVALQALVEMQEEAGRWEAAIRLLVKLAGAAEDSAVRGVALVRAAQLAETRLGKATRAVTLYKRALDEGVNTPDVLHRLFELYRELKRLEPALALADRLLLHPKFVEPNARAEVLSARAELSQSMGSIAEAQAGWLQALDLSPLLFPAVEGLLDTLDGVEEVRQRHILQTIHGGVRGQVGPAAVRVLQRLGQCLLARGDEAGALEVYGALHAMDGTHLGARAALSRLHRALAEVDEETSQDERAHVARAIDHHLAYVRAQPGDAQALHDLARLYQAAGRPAAALLPARMAAMVEGEPGPAPVCGALVRLDDGRRNGLVGDTPWRLPTGLLMRALHGWLGAEAEAVMGRPGPVKGTDLPAALAHEVADLTDALALPPRRWVLQPGSGWSVRAVRFAPLTLAVEAGVLDLPPERRRFVLARALEYTRGPARLVGHAPVGEARAIFAAALALALGQEGADYADEIGADPERIDVWGARLLEWLPDGRIDALMRFAQPVLASGETGFDDWASAVDVVAHRVGMVMAGDLRLVIEHIDAEQNARRLVGLDDSGAWRSLFKRLPRVGDLYAYAFGPRYDELSKQALS
jgi:tetratricopeptide (TPR) repeat protein